MEKYPLLPINGSLFFTGVIIPVTVVAEDAKLALSNSDDFLCVTSQENDETAFFCKILKKLQKRDGSYKILLDVIERRKIDAVEKSQNGCTIVAVSRIEHSNADELKIHALRQLLVRAVNKLVLLKTVPNDVAENISQEEKTPENISDIIAMNAGLQVQDLEAYSKMPSLVDRMEYLLSVLDKSLAIKNEEISLGSKLNARLGKAGREAFLREQMKLIQQELGGEDDGAFEEINEYAKKLENLEIQKEQKEKIESELKKFRMMTPFSSEASVTRGWLDCVLSLPWGKQSKIESNLVKASEILDADHAGLAKVKDHILEFLAVQARHANAKGQIMCLVGPPGIGKTSLAQSMAKATGRNFARISLGGIKDEAEIRGHRRTYVSAFCGRIISAIKKSGTSNPLILLDEIDKIAADFRGDPESALLEVLDPEQNSTFVDHYLEMEYDLSNVMFVATANTLNMSKPLLDRMEVIRLSGYTEQEKLEIAKTHLVEKQIHENGLKTKEIKFSDNAITKIIQNYTRESGVRNLEREISKVCRKVLRGIEESKYKSVTVSNKNLEEYLGPPKFLHDEREKKNLVGVTTGLAWTEVGGEILSIESVMYPGKGKITLTGKLGDVMQESIQAAMSLVKFKSREYGLNNEIFEKNDFHIHVPEGATPKDGPSAGIAMVTSIMSSASGCAVKSSVAMTGEITLRGRILAIGGLKEKMLAAHRSGIKTVIIPKDNQKDLRDIPEDVLNALDVHALEQIDDVLKIALCSKKSKSCVSQK